MQHLNYPRFQGVPRVSLERPKRSGTLFRTRWYQLVSPEGRFARWQYGPTKVDSPEVNSSSLNLNKREKTVTAHKESKLK